MKKVSKNGYKYSASPSTITNITLSLTHNGMDITCDMQVFHYLTDTNTIGTDCVEIVEWHNLIINDGTHSIPNCKEIMKYFKFMEENCNINLDEIFSEMATKIVEELSIEEILGDFFDSYQNEVKKIKKPKKDLVK